jgi:hypothetical protein
MTRKCKVHCGFKVNQFEIDALASLNRFRHEVLVKRIGAELKKENCNILTWFAVGDCPESLTGKITSVMAGLSLNGVVQCGFTRNETLWKHSHFFDNVTLGLTVENEKRAIELSEEGLVSVPDYSSWTITLYKKMKPIYNCGGGFGTTCGENFVITKAEEIHPEDCGKCYEGKRGCFV